MIHIPILRAGKPYQSLEVTAVPHFRSGEAVAEVSQANRGLIARDLLQMAERQQILQAFPVRELLRICRGAAKHFREAALPLGAASQSADDYIAQLSATTGMPQSLCRKNMDKIVLVLEEMEAVLGGLTRGLDLEIFDRGWIEQEGRPLSFLREADALGAILPSNSPGVHSLWLPAIPLKLPLVLKPGSQEPWTPFRIIQAFIAAGAPPEAFSFYPTDYGGAAEILLRTGRSMLFGDKNTVAPWRKDPRVQIHGPGWSKVIIADDRIANWRDYLEVIETSAVMNGGRSCINASGVWVGSRGREVAEALAQRFARIEARGIEDPEAQIAAFTNKTLARRISAMIDRQLQIPGAEDLTARYRSGDRYVEKDGCAFLLPTVIYCSDPAHPLAHSEFLFPFISVVEVPQEEMLPAMGPTLVATAITEDREFIRRIFASHNVERLNLGPIPTMKINWDQPHEGNLFEHLYRQRAFQMSG